MIDGPFAVVDGVPLPIPEHALARPLAEVLRANGVHSVKTPCREGTCGGCTVQVDNLPVLSCVLPAARVSGKQVNTARSLVTTDHGAWVAQCLAQRGALQCGFCIPGVVAGWLSRDNDAALESHLCRCTGYVGLIRALHGAPDAAPARPDGLEKASGTACYTADGIPAGTFYARILAAPRPGSVLGIDAAAAMRVSGAVAVLTPADSPPHRYDPNPHGLPDAPRENCVFTDTPRFAGDIVGLVVADNADAARLMAEAVTVQVAETTPPLPDPLQYVLGDPAPTVADALRNAAHTVVTEFDYGSGTHDAMEPLAALAWWDDRGRCHVRGSCQLPMLVPAMLAPVLDIEPHEVLVEPTALGGSFGLREEVLLEPAAAVAARRCGRPVLVETSRAETTGLRRRHAARVQITSGWSEAGDISVLQVSACLDAGAYLGHSAAVLSAMGSLALQMYPAPIRRFDGIAEYSPTAPTTAFRGYGAAEALVPLDVHIETAAGQLGINTDVLRRRNMMRPATAEVGVMSAVQHLHLDKCLDEVLERLRLLPAGGDRWRRGTGIATAVIVSSSGGPAHRDTAQARCRREEDGTLVVETGHSEMGQGTHAVLATVAAERLGVEAAEVTVRVAPTCRPVADGGTYASRGVRMTADSVSRAASALRTLIDSGAPGVLEVHGASSTADSTLAGCAQLVEVSVDTWTGRVVVDRVVSVHDIGAVMDARMAEGQVLGGVAQGLGIALSDRYPGGPLLHHSLVRSTGMPPVEVVFVESGGVAGELGAKGLGEASVVPLPAAIVNAVADATGVRMAQIPMTPETVWRALSDARTKEQNDNTGHPPHRLPR
ncbi:MAG: molybdopterin cofactor-binding domain-containing protein [Mycobacterium sp.]